MNYEMLEIMEPYYGMSYEDFPSSEEEPVGVKVVELHDSVCYTANLIPDIVYARRNDTDLHVHIIYPYEEEKREKEKRWPLIVFVQGSAFHKQDIFCHLSHMVRFAEKGYIVALVECRPSEIAPFPAQMQDCKTAIRFLRKNADEYQIDSDNVILWGDSSGGHTALMAGFTIDCEPDTELYDEYSSGVKCIIDWYGPTVFSRMNCVPSTMDHITPNSPEGYEIGRLDVLENESKAKLSIPMRYLSEEKEVPPLLIMHGDKDRKVPFNQSVLLYNQMMELGKEVCFYKLKNSDHGVKGFNSVEALGIVEDFIKKYINV